MTVSDSMQSLQMGREGNLLEQIQTSYHSAQNELTQQFCQNMQLTADRQAQSQTSIQDSRQRILSVETDEQNQGLFARVESQLAELQFEKARLQEELKNSQAKLSERQKNVSSFALDLKHLQTHASAVPARQRGTGGVIKAGNIASQLLAHEIQRRNQT